jgi:hypothetical protein
VTERIEQVIQDLGYVRWDPMSGDLLREYYLPARERGLQPDNRLDSWIWCRVEVIEPLKAGSSIKVYLGIAEAETLASESTIYRKPEGLPGREAIIAALELRLHTTVKKGWGREHGEVGRIVRVGM